MKRHTKTKSKIKQAFSELLLNKGFDRLTVSDIIEKAEINRSTFYHHYVDKYDLRDRLVADMIDQLMAILTTALLNDSMLQGKKDALSQTISQTLEYLKEDHIFVRALVMSNQTIFLSDLLKEIMEQFFHYAKDLDKDDQITPLQYKSDYEYEMFIAIIVSVFLLWVKKGMTDPISEIAQLITNQVQLINDP